MRGKINLKLLIHGKISLYVLNQENLAENYSLVEI